MSKTSSSSKCLWILALTVLLSPSVVLAQDDFEGGDEIEGEADELPAEAAAEDPKIDAQDEGFKDLESEFKSADEEGGAEDGKEDLEEQPTEEAVAAQPEVVPPPPAIVEEEKPAEVIVDTPVAPPTEPPAPEVAAEEPVTVAGQGLSPDEPDAGFEERLNRIYEKYGRERMANEEWERIAGARLSETYSIQPGDSLWEISQTLFGSGFFWPKIWQLNASITNPHLIEPGSTLTFVYGNEAEAPGIKVAQSTAVQEANDGPKLDAISKRDKFGAQVEEDMAELTGVDLPAANTEREDPEKPQIPPEEKRVQRLLKVIPSSLPDLFNYGSEPEDLDALAREMKPMNLTTVSPLPSFLSEVPPFSIGEIVDTESGAQGAQDGQRVYVRFAERVGPGVYSVVARRPPLTSIISGKEAGIPVDYVGEIKLIGPVEGQSGVYLATVLRAYGGLRVGASIQKGQVPQFSMKATSKKSFIEANLVGGDIENARATFTVGTVVYLDRGANHGIRANQMMDIMKNYAFRDGGAGQRGRGRKIGALKVIQTTPGRSTAVILESIEEIKVGDVTGRDPAAGMRADSSEVGDDELDY